MRCNIRKGNQDDIDVLVEIIQRAFQNVAERFGLTPQNSPTHPSNCRPDWLMREMNRGVVLYVLEDNGQPAGCVALEKINDDVCYLERLAVLPDQQRKGYGKMLVRHALSEARRLNVRRVQIGIIAEHEELRAWYEKLGFDEVESKAFPHLIFQVMFLAYDFL